MTKIITGTVRGRIGKKHILVTSTGKTVEVVFDSGSEPLIGGDVFGIVDKIENGAKIKIIPSVVDYLLSNNTSIIPIGNPDLTARMLGSLFKKAPPGIIEVGTAGVIERTPKISEPDLAYALNILSKEAEKIGVAINVIDVLSLAKCNYEDNKILNEIMPADKNKTSETFHDLNEMLKNGFLPGCHKTIIELEKNKIPSVDFIIPYSPFMTGIEFSKKIGGAWNSEYPIAPLTTNESRKLSALREISKAFTSRYLGTKNISKEQEEIFADCVASIIWIQTKNSPETIDKFKKLREVSVSRNKDAICSYQAIKMAMVLAIQAPMNIETILSTAASLTKSHGLKNKKEINSSVKEENVFINYDFANKNIKRIIKNNLFRDIDECLERFEYNKIAERKLMKYLHATTTTELYALVAQEYDSDQIDESINPLGYFDDRNEEKTISSSHSPETKGSQPTETDDTTSPIYRNF